MNDSSSLQLYTEDDISSLKARWYDFQLSMKNEELKAKQWAMFDVKYREQ